MILDGVERRATKFILQDYVVEQWSERSPFTSEVAGSILNENVTPTPVLHSCEKSWSTICRKSYVSPGAPVSSHNEVGMVC